MNHEYDLETVQETVQEMPGEKCDAVVLAVAHKKFLELDFSQLKSDYAVVYGVRGVVKNIKL